MLTGYAADAMHLASSSRLVVLALALVLAACGGNGDDGEADSGVQEGEARDVVLRYFRAVVAEESEKACATYLTDNGVRDIYGQESCKGVVDIVSGPVRVDSVEKSGDTARVVVFLSAGTMDGRIVTVLEEGGSAKIDAVEQRAP
jgi:hypothetical protein